MEGVINETILNALGWTLIHSIWQGLVIYAGLFLAFKLIPGRFANTRYLVSLVALLGVVAWSAVTFSSYISFNPEVSVTPNNNSFTVLFNSYSNETASHWLADLSSNISITFPYMVAIWIAGAIVLMLRTTGGLYYLGRIRKRSSELNENWQELLTRTKNKLGISRRIDLRMSSVINSPLAFGSIKPIILIPASLCTGLSSSQIEMILLHELAHIKRWDYLVNQFQLFVESLYFFNPAVWMISSKIREEREVSCDRVAFTHGKGKVEYIKTLAELEWQKNMPLTMALAGQKQSILSRMKRIMGKKTNSTQGAWMVAGFLIILSVGLISWKAESSEKDQGVLLDMIDPISSLNFARATMEMSDVKMPPVEVDLASIPDLAVTLSPIPFHLRDTVPDMEELLKRITEIQEEQLKHHKALIEKITEEELLSVMEKHKEIMEKLGEHISESINIHIPEIPPIPEFNFQFHLDSLEKVMDISSEAIEKSMQEWREVQEVEMKEAMEIARKEIEKIKELNLDKEMEAIKEELEELEEKFDAFKKELKEELVKDGHMKKGDELGGIRIEDGTIQQIDGKEFEPKDPEKYRKLVEKHLGKDFGKGKFHWNN